MEVTRREPGAPGEWVRDEAHYRTALRLSAAVALAMAAQAGTGMLFPALYRDEAFALQAWRVNDAVTLLAAVPLLCLGLVLAGRAPLNGGARLRGYLLLLGVLQYALYNDAFYLFGAALNVHLLLYVALFVLSALGLLTGLLALDAGAVARALAPRALVKPVAAYMAVWAVILGVAWIGQSLSFAITGQVPALGEEPFRLIAALDLSLVVTPVAIAAVWLWARRGWGLILSVVLNVKGALYAGLLAAGSLAGGPVVEGGGDGLLGLWAFLALGSALSAALLLAGLRTAQA
jgi:hypothetical protein